MPLPSETLKPSLDHFAAYVRSLKGDEKGEAQPFLERFFQALGHAGIQEAGATLEYRIAKRPGSAQPIRAEMDRTIARTQSMLVNLSANIERHNQTVQTQAAHTLRARKEQLLKQSNLLASLGVPIRPANHVPTTFSVPVSKTKPIIRKPDAPTKPFSPEPMLDENTYRRILELCRDMGREMERHPDLYRDRGEEALRDHFLFTLSPHFESVTAETFNKKGKTDILIRHDKANVFVAECKFWGGAKMFLATIDQALSYLTWRDSKAAVLCFNQNQQHGPVLDEIQTQTLTHPCFVKDRGRVEDGWYGYEFHLPNDPTRSVQLAVQCFHIH